MKNGSWDNLDKLTKYHSIALEKVLGDELMFHPNIDLVHCTQEADYQIYQKYRLSTQEADYQIYQFSFIYIYTNFESF